MQLSGILYLIINPLLGDPINFFAEHRYRLLDVCSCAVYQLARRIPAIVDYASKLQALIYRILSFTLRNKD